MTFRHFPLVIIVLLLSSSSNHGIQSVSPLPLESNDSPDINQWSAVPEAVDESSMMELLNSIMEMLRSGIGGLMFGSMSNDEVEVDQSNRGFMQMIHGLFSRLSNMAIDMMGQMRKIRDKSKERLTEASSSSSSSSSSAMSETMSKIEETFKRANNSEMATRLRNQMEQTKERIKDTWNNLMNRVKKMDNGTSSRMMMMIMNVTQLANGDHDNFPLIDNEPRANLNLQSDNKRVIRSLQNGESDHGHQMKATLDYNDQFQSDLSSSKSITAKSSSVNLMDRWLKYRNNQANQPFDSLIVEPNDSGERKRNIFDRMKGAMDNARTKFIGAIGKFMNGSMLNADDDDDSTNMTEEEQKNWWSMSKGNKGGRGSSSPKGPENREPISPTRKNLYPTKATHPLAIPRDSASSIDDLPPNNNNNRPIDGVGWSIRSPYPKSDDDESVKSDEPSRTTIEFMDKFKSEMEKVKTSMDGSNDNLEMAMEKLATWGLFMRSITESKNLDDFWVKLTQQANK